MQAIIILGAGGLGRETVQLIKDINHQNDTWDIKGFIDEDTSIHGKEIDGVRVLGRIDYLASLETKNLYVICAIGNTRARRSIIDRISQYNIKFATLIHPTAAIGQNALLGSGVVVGAGCVVSVNVNIKDHVYLNPLCGIGHDAIINQFSMLLWGVKLGGNTVVGEGCKIGSNAVVLQQRKIGDWAVLGAGAVANKNIDEGCTAVGVPARVINK